MSDHFYLQDSRSNVGSRAMFWRDGGGYTSNLDEAEQFTREQAVRQYECRETDLPWPVDYVRELAEVGADCQYLTRSEAEAFRNDDGRVYVSYSREWDGNDLVWRSEQGPTANLKEAIQPYAANAAGYQAQGFDLWPCGYIDERARTVVRYALLNQKQALRSVGLTLPKIKRQKYRRYVHRCSGCGRFLREIDAYTSCPNCDVSNAP